MNQNICELDTMMFFDAALELSLIHIYIVHSKEKPAGR